MFRSNENAFSSSSSSSSSYRHARHKFYRNSGTYLRGIISPDISFSSALISIIWGKEEEVLIVLLHMLFTSFSASIQVGVVSFLHTSFLSRYVIGTRRTNVKGKSCEETRHFHWDPSLPAVADTCLIGGDRLEVLFQDPAQELVDVAMRFSQFDITVNSASGRRRCPHIHIWFYRKLLRLIVFSASWRWLARSRM